MPPKRKSQRKVGRRRPAGAVKKAARKTVTDSGLNRRLSDLTERIDIVLPEVTARVAALEHVLLDLNLCSRDNLRRARDFVKEQES